MGIVFQDNFATPPTGAVNGRTPVVSFLDGSKWTNGGSAIVGGGVLRWTNQTPSGSQEVVNAGYVSGGTDPLPVIANNAEEYTIRIVFSTGHVAKASGSITPAISLLCGNVDAAFDYSYYVGGAVNSNELSGWQLQVTDGSMFGVTGSTFAYQAFTDAVLTFHAKDGAQEFTLFDGVTTRTVPTTASFGFGRKDINTLDIRFWPETTISEVTIYDASGNTPDFWTDFRSTHEVP